MADYGPPIERDDYSETHPYLTLPETYNGNQLTSYGGRIKYRVSAHNPSQYAKRNSIPDIIIMVIISSLPYYTCSMN